MDSIDDEYTLSETAAAQAAGLSISPGCRAILRRELQWILRTGPSCRPVRHYRPGDVEALAVRLATSALGYAHSNRDLTNHA